MVHPRPHWALRWVFVGNGVDTNLHMSSASGQVTLVGQPGTHIKYEKKNFVV